MLSIPGIGLLTATALVAATGGGVDHFRSARHFASWFGRTPREFSSGGTRVLGKLSKRGDRYLRMLLTHGARSVLRAAHVAERAGRPLAGLRHWAVQVENHTNHNKAACALANNLTRTVMPRCGMPRPLGSPPHARHASLSRRASWSCTEKRFPFPRLHRD